MKARDIINRDFYPERKTTKEILNDLQIEKELKQLPKESLRLLSLYGQVDTEYISFKDLTKEEYDSLSALIKTIPANCIEYVKRCIDTYVKIWQSQVPFFRPYDVMKFTYMCNCAGTVIPSSPFFLNDSKLIVKGVIDICKTKEKYNSKNKQESSCLYYLYTNGIPLTLFDITKDTGRSRRNTKEELELLKDLGLVELTEDKKWKLSFYGQTLFEKEVRSQAI